MAVKKAKQQLFLVSGYCLVYRTAGYDCFIFSSVRRTRADVIRFAHETMLQHIGRRKDIPFVLAEQNYEICKVHMNVITSQRQKQR